MSPMDHSDFGRSEIPYGHFNCGPDEPLITVHRFHHKGKRKLVRVYAYGIHCDNADWSTLGFVLIWFLNCP